MKLIYKKVSSYNEMDDINTFITIEARKGKTAKKLEIY